MALATTYWTDKFGEVGEPIFQSWLDDIAAAGVDPSRIALAYRKWTNGAKIYDVRTLIQLTKPSPSDYGLPEVEQAHQHALDYLTGKAPEPHPVLTDAIRRTGSNDLLECRQYAIDNLKKHYQENLNRLLAGHEIANPNTALTFNAQEAHTMKKYREGL